MRTCCVVAVTFLIVWGFLLVLGENEESIDFEVLKRLLKNKAIMDKVLICIKDDKSCSRFLADIKERVKGLYFSRCENCTEQERSMAKKVFVFLNSTGQWDTIIRAFDPEDTYREYFEEFLAT